jgi:N-succinyldiaminopimelate aminotransferase
VTTPLRSSMRPFGVSVFSRLTELAIRHQAVNLAQGFPDFAPPPALIAAAEQAMADGLHQYAPSIGYPRLRMALAEHSKTRYGVGYDPDTEITVTAGATEGMWTAATALMEPGDEAIVIEPFYETYPPCVAAAGGVTRFVPTTFPDFRLDLDRLAATFNSRTRLVFLNTPGNPSGRLLPASDLAVLGRLAERYDAYLVADETYEHVTFDDTTHLRVAAVPECRDRTITLSSASKTFSATGWRIGWVCAPPPVTEAVRRVHQFVTFAAASPLQHAVGVMFEEAARTGYFDTLRAEYAQRRSTLLEYLKQTDLDLTEPDGAYFILGRCEGDDVAWCENLVATRGVAAVPASVFYHHREQGRGLVRFAFCKQLDTLHEAGRRLVSR